MPRIALGLEYDGTDFVGWQIQQTGRTVEGTLAAAVSFVAGAPVTVHGSGRTDAGVHALHQVAHFDTSVARTPRQWLLGINSNLPPDVAIRWVREVPTDFDARRSAVSRRYRYTVLQQPARPALLVLPPSAGIALGLERLLMLLFDAADIDDVAFIPWSQS